MAVNIDTVYQRVLSIANKEQRGYITPQEFNLFANQAQMDIFEQYFYDLNQFGRMPSVGIEYSDIDDKIDEKLSIFKTSQSITGTAQTLGNLNSMAFSFPTPAQIGSFMYKIGTIWGEDGSTEIHKVDHRELTYIVNSPLAQPTFKRPVYVLDNNQISVFPESITSVTFRYIRTPMPATWGYTVVNEKPMYNFGNSSPFELHISEESDLVFKILRLAGINLGNELYQIAATEEEKEIQQEKQ